MDTRSNGMFAQKRIGLFGKMFVIYKIKTMRSLPDTNTTVTTQNDRRITKAGAFFRRTKIDELPQLWNVLVGDMSFVGPRPDVPGFADKLEGGDRVVLSMRPGITGPASLKYRNEEMILAQQSDPEEYNKNVIWPDKVKINKAYVANWSLKNDIIILAKTVTG
jgi:lipopolysaccharide/colanic/teichoic acid biosynthesis glycosyltransferase